MERAALYARGGPDGARGLREAAGAVGHRHRGRCDLGHEDGPGPRVLAFGEMPGKHVVFGACDEDDRAAPHPDAVKEHDVVDLACIGADRPELPKRRTLPAKGPARARHILLAVFGKQPLQKHLQAPCLGVGPMGAGGAADLAAPSLGSRRCGSVALHGAPAGLALRIIHARPLPERNFSGKKVP